MEGIYSMKINAQEVIETINKVIDSYEKMLIEVVVKKESTFDSAPYTHSIQALNKMLEKSEEYE